MTVSLPRGNETDKSDSWKRAVLSVSVEVDWVTAVDVPVEVVGEGGSAAVLLGAVERPLGDVSTVFGSDCLPLFQRNEACSKPILVLINGGSVERFKLDTQSGTA